MENQGSAESIGALATDYLARLVETNEEAVKATLSLVAEFRRVRRTIYMTAAFTVVAHILVATIAVRHIENDARAVAAAVPVTVTSTSAP